MKNPRETSRVGDGNPLPPPNNLGAPVDAGSVVVPKNLGSSGYEDRIDWEARSTTGLPDTSGGYDLTDDEENELNPVDSETDDLSSKSDGQIRFTDPVYRVQPEERPYPATISYADAIAALAQNNQEPSSDNDVLGQSEPTAEVPLPVDGIAAPQVPEDGKIYYEGTDPKILALFKDDIDVAVPTEGSWFQTEEENSGAQPAFEMPAPSVTLQKPSFGKRVMKALRNMALIGFLFGGRDNVADQQPNGSTAEELAATMPRAEEKVQTREHEWYEEKPTSRGIIETGEGVSNGLLHAGLTNEEMQHVLGQSILLGDTLVQLRDTYVIANGGELAVAVTRDMYTQSIKNIAFETAAGVPLTTAELPAFLKIVPHENFVKQTLVESPVQTAQVTEKEASTTETPTVVPVETTNVEPVGVQQPEQQQQPDNSLQRDAILPKREEDEDDIVLGEPEEDDDFAIEKQTSTEGEIQIKILKEFFDKSEHNEINFGGALLIRRKLNGQGFEIRYAVKQSQYREFTPELAQALHVNFEEKPKALPYREYIRALPEGDPEKAMRKDV